MNIDPASSAVELPIFDEETDLFYSIDVIAELSGVDPQTILHYQAQGFIRPTTPAAKDDALFDAECLRQLRRIQHLRATCEVNDTGLKLILDLLYETECLREERRQRRP
jgi:DNA-binding transcriptional MerR regulator